MTDLTQDLDHTFTAPIESMSRVRRGRRPL